MKTEPTQCERGLPLPRLVRLARDLRRVAGGSPGATLAEARKMPPEQLEEKLRDFVDWFIRDCENRSQMAEQLLAEWDEFSEVNSN